MLSNILIIRDIRKKRKCLVLVPAQYNKGTKSWGQLKGYRYAAMMKWNRNFIPVKQ